jgi:hypothetical protein
MTEMLMTTAETNNDGSASQTPADGVTQQAQANSAASQAGNQQQAAGDQSQQPQGEGNVGEGDGNTGETQTTLGAPESYEFKPVENVNLDPGVIDAFAEVAKELDLSQAAAEKVLNKMAPVLAERSAAQIQQAQQQWVESSIKDKEFGGEKLQENLAVAKKAMDAFATPELKQLLNESGLGNHPEVIRMMYRAGKAISEDGYVGPSQGAGSAKGSPKDFNSAAAALYSNQQT